MILRVCAGPAGLRSLRPGSLRPLVTHHCYSSTSIPTVSLVYDLHEPAKPVSDNPNQTSPILFLHGLFGSKKNNRSISRALARELGRSIYALDLRNHGDSPHDPRHDYTAMAEDVSAFIEEHKLEQPTLIGHSMGAKTAMALALRSPGMVKDIVSVDNAPVDAILSTDFAKYVRGMEKVEAAGVSSQKEADAILAEFEEVCCLHCTDDIPLFSSFSSSSSSSFSSLSGNMLIRDGIKSLPIRQFLLGNLYTPEGQKTKKFRVPIDVLGKSLSHMGDFPYKDPSKARFERPALFVRGTKSKYVPDEVLPVLGQFFPLFEVVDIDAGHWVISEDPEAFGRAVVRFLGPKD